MPADLGANLVEKRFRRDALAFERADKTVRLEVVLLGHVGQLILHFIIRRDDADFLLFLHATQFLHLQALIHQGHQRFLLELGQGVLGGLDA